MSVVLRRTVFWWHWLMFWGFVNLSRSHFQLSKHQSASPTTVLLGTTLIQRVSLVAGTWEMLGAWFWGMREVSRAHASGKGTLHTLKCLLHRLPDGHINPTNWFSVSCYFSGQMDRVWRNDSNLYYNVLSSQVPDMTLMDVVQYTANSLYTRQPATTSHVKKSVCSWGRES